MKVFSWVQGHSYLTVLSGILQAESINYIHNHSLAHSWSGPSTNEWMPCTTHKTLSQEKTSLSLHCSAGSWTHSVHRSHADSAVVVMDGKQTLNRWLCTLFVVASVCCCYSLYCSLYLGDNPINTLPVCNPAERWIHACMKWPLPDWPANMHAVHAAFQSKIIMLSLWPNLLLSS